MSARPYRHPDRLPPAAIDPRSRAPDDHYPPPAPAWHPFPHRPFPDLPLSPQPAPSPHIPSPLSTPSNHGNDSSPIDYFSMQSLPGPQHDPWAPHQPVHQRAPPISFFPPLPTTLTLTPCPVAASMPPGPYIIDGGAYPRARPRPPGARIVT